MDRRTVTFVLLSLVIWYAWLAVFPPPAPPEATDGVETVETAPLDPSVPAAPVPADPVVPAHTEPFAGCGVQATWSSEGGELSDLVLPGAKAPYTVTPLYSWVLGGFGAWHPYGEDPGPAVIFTEEARGFAVGAGPLGGEPVALSGTPARSNGRVGGVSVTRTLTETPGEPCTFELTVTWSNPGSAPFDGPLWIGVHDRLPEGGGMLARYTSQSSAMASVDEGVWTLTDYGEVAAPELVDDAPVEWFGIGDRYFAAYLAPDEPHGRLYKSRVGQADAPLDGMHWVAREGLAPGESHSEKLLLYVGVKDMDVLAAAKPSLENAVELGWFAIFGYPLLWLLKFYQGFVHNWGIAIVLLTLSVKALFFPLTQSAFRSGQAMQAVQPKLQEIREQFAEDPAELNRRTMELFKEHQVNPLGGCLPMILQIPVWIALYNVLLTSVELYQTEFLYLRDLSSVDPYCVLPAIVIVVMMIQQRFTPTGNMDPAQAQMMKLMPLMFGIFFFTLPSGLVVYMFVNMVLSVLQQWYIKRSFAAPEPAGAPG